MTYEEMFDEAIAKLTKMNDHHPAFVMYSEAKFLYTLLPELIGVLELGKQFNIDKLTHEEDIEAHRELINLVTKIAEAKPIE